MGVQFVCKLLIQYNPTLYKPTVLSFILSGWQYIDRDVKKAMKYYLKATEVNASSSLAWERLGTFQLDQKSIKEAELSYKRAFNLDKTDENYKMLIYLSILQSDLKKASFLNEN